MCNLQGIHSSTDVVLSPITVNKSATIADYAKNNQIDLIIVGIKKRSSFVKFLFGDSKANVYNQVNCPVPVIQ